MRKKNFRGSTIYIATLERIRSASTMNVMPSFDDGRVETSTSTGRSAVIVEDVAAVQFFKKISIISIPGLRYSNTVAGRSGFIRIPYTSLMTDSG